MNKIEKIPEINARIMQVIDYYSNKNVTKFANSIEITQQTLNRLFIIDKRTGKYPLATTEIIKKISEMYDIDANWIITGDGNMLKSSSNVSQINPQAQPSSHAPALTDQSPGPECRLCKEKDLRIVDLQKSVEFWQENFKSMGKVLEVVLKSNKAEIDTLKAQVDDLQQQHFDDEQDATSQAG